MGFFSDLIGGKHKTIPTSSSESSATQQSKSGSTSSGLSESFGTSLSGSESSSRSVSDVFGGDIFRTLFGNATNAAASAADMVPGLRGTAETLFGAGGRFLEELEGGTETAGRLADPGFEDEQIGQLSSDLGRFYAEEIDPQIVGRGVATGTLGGSRGEVARGAASRGLAEEFTSGSIAIRQAGTERRDRLAAAADTMGTDRATRGLASLPGLYGLAEAGLGAELAPYMQLSQILGGPTVLTQSEAGSVSGSSSEQGSFASQLSEAFSESFGQSSSSSQGSTVTKGPGLLDVLDTLSNFA